MQRLLWGFCLGVLSTHLVPGLPPVWLPAACLALAVPGLCRPSLRLCWAFLAGVALVAHAGHAWLDQRLPPARDGEVVTVTGRIHGLPAHGHQSTRFILMPDRNAGGMLPERIEVRWFRPAASLEAGSRWRLRLRLGSPATSYNPGGIDRERQYLLEGIGALASVVDHPHNRRLAAGRGLHAWRERLAAAIREQVPGESAAALAVALTVGDRQYLDPALRERLVRTGTAHLIAISGLHVGLVAGTVWLLCAAGWRLLAFPAARFPASLAGIPPALAAAATYAALAGFALPTQRALIMLCLGFLALWLRHGSPAWTVLLLALAGVLALDPLAPLGPGLWLSFGAVATLLLVLGDRPLAGASPLLPFARAQLALLPALLPLTLSWFGRVAWVAPLANAVAIPLVGSLVVPLLLAGTLALAVHDGAGGFLLAWAGWLLGLLDQALHLLGGVDSAVSRPRPAPWMLVPAFAGVLLLLLPWGTGWRVAGLSLLLPLLLWRPAVIPEGEAMVVIGDAGHGHATLVATRRHLLLVDAGPPRFAPELSAMLRRLGVQRVDRLVLTNSRAGSRGGADSLTLPVVKRVEHTGDEPCRDQPPWQWDSVRFRFLDGKGAGDCLLLVEAGGGRLLIAQGANAAGRRALEGGLAGETVDWLVVPAHGHRDGSSAALARALMPRAAIVPVDRNNRFGLPHGDTRAAWRGVGSKLVITGESGAVIIRVAAGTLETARGGAAFWRHSPVAGDH